MEENVGTPLDQLRPIKANDIPKLNGGSNIPSYNDLLNNVDTEREAPQEVQQQQVQYVPQQQSVPFVHSGVTDKTKQQEQPKEDGVMFPKEVIVIFCLSIFVQSSQVQSALIKSIPAVNESPVLNVALNASFLAGLFYLTRNIELKI